MFSITWETKKTLLIFLDILHSDAAAESICTLNSTNLNFSMSSNFHGILVSRNTQFNQAIHDFRIKE